MTLGEVEDLWHRLAEMEGEGFTDAAVTAALAAALRRVLLEERAACARLCEDETAGKPFSTAEQTGKWLAGKIRGRGER